MVISPSGKLAREYCGIRLPCRCCILLPASTLEPRMSLAPYQESRWNIGPMRKPLKWQSIRANGRSATVLDRLGSLKSPTPYRCEPCGVFCCNPGYTSLLNFNVRY